MTEREFEKMIREHKGTIYTVCYMFSTDRDEVADLFQEILIHLWQGSGTFRGDSALNTWIWKVSLNTCISFDRKKKRGLRTEPLSLDIDLFDDRGIRGVAHDGRDALLHRTLAGIHLAGADDLAVAGLQVEERFAVLGDLDFEALLDGTVLADGLDAVEAGAFGGIDLAGGDDLAVAGLEVE